MMDRRENRVVAGTGAPGKAELARLASQGFASVVDLRTGREPDQILPPEREREEAQRCGLRYVHLPVDGANPDAATIENFRQEVAHMPSPVYVHCSSGRRAQAVVAAAFE